MTDPEARLARKGPGKPAILAYLASVMTDNRHGLVVATAVGPATGTAEVEQAEIMLGAVMAEPAGRTGHRTVGADKLYDELGFVDAARRLTRKGYSPPESREYAGGTVDANGHRQLALPLKHGYMAKQLEVDFERCESIVGYSRKWFDELPKPAYVIRIANTLAMPSPADAETLGADPRNAEQEPKAARILPTADTDQTQRTGSGKRPGAWLWHPNGSR